MPREEFIRKILGAIHEGHTSEQGIASHLETEQYRVHSALATLNQESYIKGAESSSQRGELEYVACTLTPKGQTMLNYPDDLPEQSRLRLQQKFNISDSNIASVTGSGHIDNATINNYSPEQRQSLTEAANEIQELLNQLSQTYNPPNPLNNSKIATAGVEAIENNQALKSKIIKVLKAGGTETLKELIDHPAVNIVMACVEAWKDD
ncbi:MULTISPECIES: hypothetical protein [Spirulina sp. CCY15215]|uniref:hypothetical protein n=1 Tax=Spirulina sp. CCY15215 TaxID=2767591 RepID=UPI0019502352|nr:hypothetical protein [Spirulina major]